MTSPLLALFSRSLREDARGKLTYFARAGLVLMILLFLFFTQAQMGWASAPGLRFFQAVMTINCCFIVLAGLSYFSSAITEEKEEMTLGLLRMTNLNPLSILLGKSTSRVCGALLLLTAQFPFTLLAVSLGGISLGQIVACYCTLAAFIVFLSNLALLASVVCRRSGGAAVLTGSVLACGFIVVPVLNFFASLGRRTGVIVREAPWVSTLNRIAEGIDRTSPFNRLGEILSTGFGEGPWGWQVGSNLALGAGCFLFAWALFDHFCNEQPEAGAARGLVTRGRSFASPGRPWKRALVWKDFHFVTGGKGVFALKLIVYSFPLIVAWGFDASWRNTGWTVFSWMSFVLIAEAAFAVSRVFRIERQWKTLSSLAMLPTDLRWVAYEKLCGGLLALIPGFLWLAFGVLLAWGSFSRDLGSFSGEAAIVFGYLATQFIFFLHLVAWLSLRMKRGALAVAIGVHFVSQLLLATVLGSAADSVAGLIPLIVVLIVATFALHGVIITLLETLAAED
jgi:hypothetical protein